MAFVETRAKHLQICNDLNIDRQRIISSWNNYVIAKRSYTLEGDQSYWLVCAIYLACQKPSVDGNIKNERIFSLTKLLRACKMKPIQFIEVFRKWTKLLGLIDDFQEEINSLEHKLSVSKVVFEKFRCIFDGMFEYQNNEVIDQCNKNKSIVCTVSRLMEFTWTLYLLVKSEFEETSVDIVKSYHFLLSCCDLVYANAIFSDRRDILNRKFPGLPIHFFDDDYDPPSDPICVIDELCKSYEAIPLETKEVREYHWKPQMKKLFEREILTGDSSTFTDILNGQWFDTNFRSINKQYEQFLLNVGDFDERMLLYGNQNEDSLDSTPSNAKSNESTSASLPTPPYQHTKTPLTSRLYLRNRLDFNSPNTVPHVKEGVLRLQNILRTPYKTTELILLDAGCSKQHVDELVQEIKSKISEMRKLCCPPTNNTGEGNEDHNKSQASVKRFDLVERLFYKLLAKIASSEVNINKEDVCAPLRQDLFLRSLFACALEIIIVSFECASIKFPWSLNTLKLAPYHFYKIIELVVRSEISLSREMVKHLSMIEESILDNMSWASESPLWQTIKDSNMDVPNCENVCLSQQQTTSTEDVGVISSNERETMNGVEVSNNNNNNDNNTNNNDNNTNNNNNNVNNLKPKRGGSLGIFFRKFYHLASIRMQDLCNQLKILDQDVRLKIWTCFEHVIVNSTMLLKNRYLDQILMCTVYVASKVLELNLSFQEIMRCYRMQPQSASHIYRDVLLTSDTNNGLPEERGDLIKFYNKVFVRIVQTFALRFSAKNKGQSVLLSPLPKINKLSSPYRRVSENLPIYIKCMDNSSSSVAPSPIKSVRYIFQKSPARDLHGINNVIQKNAVAAVKRSISGDTDDAKDGSLKKKHLLNGC